MDFPINQAWLEVLLLASVRMKAFLVVAPPFAHQALGIDRSIGLLLPCNVVVRAAGPGTLVEALDPQIMVTLTGRPELKPVADEAARRLAGALAALTS